MKSRGKTVILVTHALHFLSQVDYIYTMVDGRIAEQGSYDQLVENEGAFARLIKEFGGGAEEEEDEDKAKPAIEAPKIVGHKSAKTVGKAAGTGKIEGRLIKAEKRTGGSLGVNGSLPFACAVGFNY
jgi:ABC-type multidrug transport system ATPase subunit